MTARRVSAVAESTFWRLAVGGFVAWLLYHGVCIAVVRCDIEAKRNYVRALRNRPPSDREPHWADQVAFYEREIVEERSHLASYFGAARHLLGERRGVRHRLHVPHVHAHVDRDHQVVAVCHVARDTEE